MNFGDGMGLKIKIDLVIRSLLTDSESGVNSET
jgi:hypothetical protein